ncbi:unnamed protein product [Discula destructiva]
MSLNGRLSSLLCPRLARHASCRRTLLVRPQRRCLNEFIHRAPQAPSPLAPGSFRLAIKDNIATHPADGPTTCASAILAGHNSPYEATVVAQLKARGAVVVGKTNLDEFGMGGHSVHSVYGAVAQELPDPDNPESQTIQLSAGGSSGGSALAVASGQADVALGTDTGGSVRLPAAYCGVVGYKPSYGMLSRYGVVPYANSLDTVGLLARDVREIRRLVVGSGLWAEGDPLDPTNVENQSRVGLAKDREHYIQPVDAPQAKDLLRPLTFGIPVEYNIEELDPRLRQAWADAATLLQDTVGARVVPVSLPSTRQALSAYYVIAPAEASSNLAKYDGVRYGPKQHEMEGKRKSNDKGSSDEQGQPVLYSTVRGAGFGPEVQRRILLGAYTLSSEAMDNHFLQAQRVRRLVRRDFDRVFALANPLVDADEQHFELADMDESVLLESKLGPAQVDFLLCPTAPTLAPRLDEVRAQMERNPTEAYMNDVFTVPASLAGLPAVSIPWPVEGDVLGKGVMGLQLIGQYWDDARMLGAADALSLLKSGEGSGG